MPQTPVEALGEADESRQGMVRHLCPERRAAPAAGDTVTFAMSLAGMMMSVAAFPLQYFTK